MKKKTKYLVSNTVEGPRSEIYTWSILDEETMSHLDKANFNHCKKKAAMYFDDKLIKWYIVYETELDTSTGSMTLTVLESEAYEDIPPLEINTVAKDFKLTAAPKKKAIKPAPVQMTIEAAEQQASVQAIANLVQGVVDQEL